MATPPPADLVRGTASSASQTLRAQNFLPRGDCSLSELVSITAREHLSKTIIRAYDKDALMRLEKIVGSSLPRNNKVVSPQSKDCEDCELLWLGPNELLLRTLASERGSDASSRVASLEEGLKGTHFLAVDVSDYYTVIRVEGVRARAVLQKNCPLDFHPDAIGAGDCAQSVYGKSSVLFSCSQANTLANTLANTFDLQIRISLASYLWSMLEVSTRSERD